MRCYIEHYGFQLIYAGVILLASDDPPFDMALMAYGSPLAISDF